MKIDTNMMLTILVATLVAAALTPFVRSFTDPLLSAGEDADQFVDEKYA